MAFRLGETVARRIGGRDIEGKVVDFDGDKAILDTVHPYTGKEYWVLDVDRIAAIRLLNRVTMEEAIRWITYDVVMDAGQLILPLVYKEVEEKLTKISKYLRSYTDGVRYLVKQACLEDVPVSEIKRSSGFRKFRRAVEIMQHDRVRETAIFGRPTPKVA